MSRDDPHFRLRIPEDLKNLVAEAAAENHRSINAEIISRLSRTFEGNLADLSGEGFGALIKRLEATVEAADFLLFEIRDVLPGLDKFMVEGGLERKEAIHAILRDWLVGHGYLDAASGD